MPYAWQNNACRGRIRIQVAAGLIVLACLFLFANQGFRKMMRNRRELKHLDEEIIKLKEEKRSLIRERDLARNNTSYLERTARKELGLIQPGEIEYRFIEAEQQ